MSRWRPSLPLGRAPCWRKAAGGQGLGAGGLGALQVEPRRVPKPPWSWDWSLLSILLVAPLPSLDEFRAPGGL